MKAVKPFGILISTSLFSAIAASLCCITPVIALFAGSSTVAANLPWLDHARPYLIILSIVVLAIAWYQQLKRAKKSTSDCDCKPMQKTSFLHSKYFLLFVTVFSILMMTFPLYASVFYPKTQKSGVTDLRNDNTTQGGEILQKDTSCSKSEKSCCEKKQ